MMFLNWGIFSNEKDKTRTKVWGDTEATVANAKEFKILKAY